MTNSNSQTEVLSSYTLQVILSNAQFHSDLQQTLQDLRDVPSQLEDHERYIEDLETSLRKVKKRVSELADITKRERKEHEGLRDSTVRKLAHKVIRRESNWEMKREVEDRCVTLVFASMGL